MITSGLNDNQLLNAIDPISSHLQSNSGAMSVLNTDIDLNNQGTNTLTEFGQTKNKILSLTFDQINKQNDVGTNSVNPIGYLTEMNTISQTSKSNKIGDVADIKKARALFQALIQADPKNDRAWIAAARLEEEDGKISDARNIISQACQNIENSEDLWLEAARLHVNNLNLI